MHKHILTTFEPIKVFSALNWDPLLLDFSQWIHTAPQAMPFSGHGCTATQCGGAELSWLERQRKNTELNISHRYELEVSLNGGTPKSSIFNRIFRYKLSIYWGTLPFMEVTNSSWFLLLHVESTTYRWLALRSPTCMESPGGEG